MGKYILESVNQINWLAIIPLLFFFLYFGVTVVQTMMAKQEKMDKMANMPLED